MPLESESLPKTSNESMDENKKIKYTNSKKGGPYSEEQREKRRDEVRRLHFEYGYPARRIAEMIKVNRNTVNDDMNYLYAISLENYNTINPEVEIILSIQRLERQVTRLREDLDKTTSIKEKMLVERMILENESRVISMHIRLAESKLKLMEGRARSVTNYLEEKQSKPLYLTFGDNIYQSQTHDIKKFTS